MLFFAKRHNLRMKAPRPVEPHYILRRETIEEWMDQLESLMMTLHYLPAFIFNCDETMLWTGKTRLKVIAQSSGVQPTLKQLEKREHITLGVCVAAGGGYLTPLLVLPLKTLPALPSTLIDFYAITGQNSGWVTEEVWRLWVRDVFIPHIEEKRQQLQLLEARALLILDGHASRLYPTAIELLRGHSVDVLVIPAHSSPILQPLDLAPFASFKSNLVKHFRVQENESRVEQRQRLLAVAALCLDSALTVLHVTAGFRKAGIWPLNKAALLQSSLIASPFDRPALPSPTKKHRGPLISGTLLTHGTPAHALSSSASTPVIEPEMKNNHLIALKQSTN